MNDPVVKREEFAVSLRSKKKSEIIKQKRKKIMDSINTKVQIAQSNGQIKQIDDLFSDSYQGYPEWRKSNYEPMLILMGELFGDQLSEINQKKVSSKFKNIC